jgi:hypothetical protein
VLLAAVCLCSLAAGCAHPLHTTEVMPGFQVAAAGGGGVVDDEGLYVARLDLGYGWAWGEGKGFQLQLMLPLEEPPETLMFSAVDLYCQFYAQPDLGAGVLLGLAPAVYFQIGRGWHPGPDTRLGIDFQLQTGFILSPFEEWSTLGQSSGQLLLSLQLHWFRFGAWITGGVLYQVSGCPYEDGCAYTVTDAQLGVAGGLLIGATIGRP